MPINKAKNIFLGRDGEKRQNCAQSVLSAFKQEMNIGEELINLAKAYGGGRAPDGICGAYWAAKLIIEKYCCPEKAKEFEEFFNNQADSLLCKEIRKNKKLSCLGCVEKATEFIVKSKNKN